MPCSTASCKSCREAHHTYRFTIRCLLLVYGHTSCSQPSNAARCVFTDPEAVRLPALPSHLDPLSLLCSAACCYSDSWVAAAVCACSAITRARARRACRCGPHKCQPRFDQARQCPRPHLAGCGHTSQSHRRRLLSWASCSSTWDGVSGALLVEPSLSYTHVFSRALLHAGACSRSGRWPPRRACVEDLTASRPAAACCVPVWRWQYMTVSASCGPSMTCCAALLQAVRWQTVPRGAHTLQGDGSRAGKFVL